MARDYKQEYRTYHAKPEQKKRRVGRNKARRLMIRKVGRSKLAGKGSVWSVAWKRGDSGLS